MLSNWMRIAIGAAGAVMTFGLGACTDASGNKTDPFRAAFSHVEAAATDMSDGVATMAGNETSQERADRKEKLDRGGHEPHIEYTLRAGGDLVDPTDHGGWASRDAWLTARKARETLAGASGSTDYKKASDLIKKACDQERATAQKHIGLITILRDKALDDRKEFPNGNEAIDVRIERLNKALAWFQDRDSTVATVVHPYGGSEVSLTAILASRNQSGAIQNAVSTASH